MNSSLLWYRNVKFYGIFVNNTQNSNYDALWSEILMILAC